MMKKRIKIICVLLTTVVILTCFFGMTSFAEGSPDIIASGYCGLGINEAPEAADPYIIAQNLSWTLDSDGTLIIRGTGKMMHFYDGDQEYYCAVPWNKDAVKKVIIEDGVETIGMGAFYNCPQLDSVAIPAGLKSIYQNAFNGSKKLVSIALPDSVDMGDISSCLGGVKHITIFRGAYDKAGNWANGSLGGYDGDEENYIGHVISATVKEGTRYIPISAFSLENNLKKLILSKSVNHIGTYAFYGCTGLKTIYYTGNESQWNIFREDICNYTYGDFNYMEHMMENSELYVLYNSSVYFCSYNDGHYIINTDATEPSATEHGYTAGIYCVDCETWISGHEVIHNTLGEMTVLIEPTETESGECIIVCTVCGESGLYAMDPIILDPDDPDGPSIDEPEDGEPNDDDGFFSNIRRMMRTIIDFFLRILRWLGGKK